MGLPGGLASMAKTVSKNPGNPVRGPAGEPVVCGSSQAVLLAPEHLQSAGLAWDVADCSCF